MFKKKREEGRRRGFISRYVTIVLLAFLALVVIWYMWQQQFPKDAITIFEETPNITSVEVVGSKGEVKTYKGKELTPFVENNAVAGMVELKGEARQQFEKKRVASVRFYVDKKELYTVDILQVKKGEVIPSPHKEALYDGQYAAYWKKHKQQMDFPNEWFEKVLQ